MLVVLDGGKTLRAAVNEVFGPVPVQRCVRHKERNVLDHLPERDRAAVKTRLRRAWAGLSVCVVVVFDRGVGRPAEGTTHHHEHHEARAAS